LVDNSLSLSGASTDCIILTTELNAVQDVISMDIQNLGIIPIQFPPMLNVPVWRFVGGVAPVSANDTKEEPIIAVAPVSINIDQGSYLLRFIENTLDTVPWVLILQVLDIQLDFGIRTPIKKNLVLGYYSTPLDPQVLDWVNKLARRRGILGW
jgi:hypothetical protein